MQENSLKTSQDSLWTVGRVLEWMTARFAALERATPRLDAQLLLGAATGLTRVQLYTRLDQPLSTAERAVLRDLVQRRVRGEPVAYILKNKEWHDLSLYVDERVLIPRPETETLYDLAQGWAAHVLGVPALVIDLCTGSGCLALALARRFPGAHVIGVDVSPGALEVCALNQGRAGVSNVEWVQDDVSLPGFSDRLLHWVSRSCAPPEKVVEPVELEGAHPDGREGGVLLISNPPYVSEHEWNLCDLEVRDFEPRLALVSEDDGLALSRCLVGHWQRMVQSRPDLRALLCLEGADGHPARLAQKGVRAELPSLVHCSAHQHAREFPLNELFAARDLEGRARFLMDSFGCPGGARASELDERQRSPFSKKLAPPSLPLPKSH